jgi:diadenosine tetraphosphate (Ap4A) HIT family hydrolase
MSKQAGCCYCEDSDFIRTFSKKICSLKVSDLYLFNDQRYYGRCIVALKEHAQELCDLSESDRHDLMDDLAAASGAIRKVTNCDKINYTIFGDGVKHLHMHLVPKKEGGPEWGGPFILLDSGENRLPAGEEAELIAKIKENL